MIPVPASFFAPLFRSVLSSTCVFPAGTALSWPHFSFRPHRISRSLIFSSSRKNRKGCPEEQPLYEQGDDYLLFFASRVLRSNSIFSSCSLVSTLFTCSCRALRSSSILDLFCSSVRVLSFLTASKPVFDSFITCRILSFCSCVRSFQWRICLCGKRLFLCLCRPCAWPSIRTSFFRPVAFVRG